MSSMPPPAGTAAPKENRTVPPLRYDVVYQLRQDFPGLRLIINGGIETEAGVRQAGTRPGEAALLLARGLSPRLRPLRAIGYRQAVRVARGEMEAEAARTEIVAETMRYAKRQMTWFRHQAETEWYGSSDEAQEAVRMWLRHQGTPGSLA